MDEDTINSIDKAVTSDPDNRNWIKLVLYPFILFGLLATIVSGYIEFKFFTGIFQDFFLFGLLFVISFEGAKIGAIVIYEYVKKHSEIQFSSGLTAIIFSLRIFLIAFSVICSFSKISQYLDNPNYEREFNAARQRIWNQYQNVIDEEDRFLQASISDAKKIMDTEARVYVHGQWDGDHYKEDKRIWEKAKSDRATRLKDLRDERDSKIRDVASELKTDSKSKNHILIGIYNTFFNIGVVTNFNRFYSIFVLLIAAFTTLILELIIWAVFGIIGAIYEGVFKAKIDSYVEMKKTLESTKVSNYSEDLNTFNFLRNIKRTFMKGFSKTKSFVDETED